MKKIFKNKTNSLKFFSNKELNIIAKKTDKKIKQAIDLAYNRIKKFHLNKNFFLINLKISIKTNFLISIHL